MLPSAFQCTRTVCARSYTCWCVRLFACVRVCARVFVFVSSCLYAALECEHKSVREWVLVCVLACVPRAWVHLWVRPAFMRVCVRACVPACVSGWREAVTVDLCTHLKIKPPDRCGSQWIHDQDLYVQLKIDFPVSHWKFPYDLYLIRFGGDRLKHHVYSIAAVVTKLVSKR